MTRRNPFDEIFEEINRMMRQLADENSEMRAYSFGLTPDDLRERATTDVSREEPSGTDTETSPRVEVFDDDDSVRVVADLPGVRKDDISLSGTDESLRIRASTDDRNYDTTVQLPERVDPDTAEATYRNGVLETTLEKEEDIRGKEIDIE
ncbi:MAG: Hsp20/alpha crystallin family protein [Halobacteria archaeon]|nr:Hsp20/alpha crystallin family protein [Halobacteria archaeon]